LLKGADVEFIGEIGEHQKSEFLGNAAALLFPIAWREPFGLVMIESLACGTPVVAFNNGSVPEVLENGLTGFIVNSEREAVAALCGIRNLDRARVRAEFERRFTARHMAQNYVKMYTRLAKPRTLIASTPLFMPGDILVPQAAAKAAAPTLSVAVP
jgi:glycosyltransferase involved in cell wall biosynthesis